MYKVVISSHFKKQLKPLVKKYRHLKENLESMLTNFNKGAHQALGKNTYKARLKSQDLPRGKNKSFKLIVLVGEQSKLLAPITIYFKGEKENISKKEINYHLTMTILELQKQHKDEN